MMSKMSKLENEKILFSNEYILLYFLNQNNWTEASKANDAAETTICLAAS